MNISDVIEAFGGTARMAERFEVVPSAVSNWKKAGRFPDRLHYRIAQEAQRDGIAIDPKIFNASEAA